ncbi:MAG: hypothetical protein WC768_03750 [Patescibacteria group bacterium]|jgi:hypothetical protein
MLIRTFPRLADGCSPLYDWLLQLRNVLTGTTIEDTCDGVVATLCDNPQAPTTGEKLWQRIQNQFGGNFELAVKMIGDKIAQLQHDVWAYSPAT